MSNWKEKPLSEYCEFQEGYVNPPKGHSEYFGGDIKWCRAVDINNGYVYSTSQTLTDAGFNSAKKSAVLFKPNTIVITKSGTIGRLGIIKDYMCGNRATINIIPKNNADVEFVFYLLRSRQNEFFDLAVGSVQKNLYVSILEKMMFKFPSLYEQKKIASFFSVIDKKIDINNRINRNLYEQAVALFEAMYQGYPVKKIGELDIFVTDYVANGSFASLKENVIILEEKNYAYFIRNVDLKAKEFPRFVNQNSYEFLSKSKLVGGEVIISNVGDVGSVFLCPKLDGPMTLGNNMIMLTSPKHNNYLYLFFKSYIGQGKIGGITGGSAQPKFNKTDFKSLEINYPDESQVDEFNEKTSALLDMISKLDEENKRLTALRDSLLPKLMSGELDISDLDI